MKTIHTAIRAISRKSFVLSAGLLALGGAMNLAQPSQAAPRDNRNVRQEQRDVKKAQKVVVQERRDVRGTLNAAQRREAQRDLQRARENLREERRDVRQERREDRRDNRPGFGNRSRNNSSVWNNRSSRPGYNNRPTWNGGSTFGGQSYTGTVTSVRSDQSFDVRVGGSTYNVYTNSRTPRGLSAGDQVRVSGVRQNNNDIRQATVSIIRNR